MAGDLLFDRRCKLVLAYPLANDFKTLSARTVEINDLRISFRIKKTLSKDPNTAEIKVYNLSADRRASLPGKGAKVLLQAGYAGTLDQIFLGDARLIEHSQEGADWVTTIECGDGARAYRFAHVSESFSAGVPYADVISKIASVAGLDVGNLGTVAAQTTGQFPQGYTVHGPAIKELAKVLEAAGYDLSIQDGTLQALTPGSTTTETVVVLDSDSGLIGSPEMGSAEKKDAKPLLNAKSLLQPILRPGRKVRLSSRLYKGLFRVATVEHSGDTASGPWESSLELEAL
jgi:hypothetical protein